MKQIIILSIVLSFIKPLSAQLSVGYYPFQSEISVTTNSDYRIWGDLRFATNTFFGNMTTEPAFMVNIKKKESHNIYTGVGLNVNFFNAANNISIINGYTLHIGTRIKPFKQKRNIQCLFELSPYMNPEFDGGLFRTRLGLAYQF